MLHRVTQLDPRLCGDSLSSSLQYYLHEGLFKMTTKPLEKGLISHYTTSEDKKFYTFTLKKAHWSDGSIITSFDFINSWNELLSPDFPSQNAELLFCIKNGRAIKRGEQPIASLGLKALNETQIEIELEEPYPHLLDILSFSTLAPYKKKGDKLLYSGPFILDSMSNSQIVLKKNPYYYDKKSISLQKVVIFFIDNANTIFYLFKNKQIDVLAYPFVSMPAFISYSNDKSYNEQAIEIPATTYLCFNHSVNTLKDIEIRKNLIASLHSDSFPFINHSLFIKPETFASPQLSTIPLLPITTKKQELTSFPKTLTLRYPQSFPHHELALFIQEKWKRLFGITVKLVKNDTISHLDCLKKRNFEIALTYSYAQYPNIYSILERFKSRSNPKNYISWENKEYQSFLKKNQIKLALNKLQESSLIFPLLHHKKPQIYHKNIKNVQSTPSGVLYLQRIIKE